MYGWLGVVYATTMVVQGRSTTRKRAKEKSSKLLSVKRLSHNMVFLVFVELVPPQKSPSENSAEQKREETAREQLTGEGKARPACQWKQQQLQLRETNRTEYLLFRLFFFFLSSLPFFFFGSEVLSFEWTKLAPVVSLGYALASSSLSLLFVQNGRSNNGSSWSYIYA